MGLGNNNLLLEAGNALNNAETVEDIFKIFVEYANIALKPDLICFYLDKNKIAPVMKLNIKKGYTEVPDVLSKQSELLSFLLESGELVCLNSRKQSPFEDLLLSEAMESGLGIPLSIGKKRYGIVLANSKGAYFFKKREITFLEDLSSILISKDLNRRLK